MTITVVWQCVYPWDIRIEKFLNLFSKEGHEVHLICKGKHGLPTEENTFHGKIHRVFLSPSWIGSFLSRLSIYPLFINPVWIYKTVKILKQNKSNIIIVRDLPLALMTGVIGKFLRIPVILDVAENYPAALIAYSKQSYKPFLFMNGILPRLYERISLRFMDQIFVVAEEQRIRLNKLGISKDRISCVLNTPELSVFYDGMEVGMRERSLDKERPILLYVGKVDKHRGVHLLIEAMPEVLKKYPETRLEVIGDGTELNLLRNLVKELSLERSVDLKSWVNFREVPGIIRRSTICLIPHLKSEHTDTTIPNKIFDYMAMGKPVVVSDCDPLKRIIEEEKCGLTFKSGDAKDLSEKVIQILRDHNMNAYGVSGKKAVEEKYNWDRDSEKVLNVIHTIHSYRVKKHSHKHLSKTISDFRE